MSIRTCTTCKFCMNLGRNVTAQRGQGVEVPRLNYDSRVISLYFRRANLSCRRCIGFIYASEVCGKHSRPILQAKSLRTFLELKTYMQQSNRPCLKAPPQRQSNHTSEPSAWPTTPYSAHKATTELEAQCIGPRGMGRPCTFLSCKNIAPTP